MSLENLEKPFQFWNPIGLKIVNFESCENFESGFLIFQWKLSVLRIVSFGLLENVVV